MRQHDAGAALTPEQQARRTPGLKPLMPIMAIRFSLRPQRDRRCRAVREAALVVAPEYDVLRQHLIDSSSRGDSDVSPTSFSRAARHGRRCPR